MCLYQRRCLILCTLQSQMISLLYIEPVYLLGIKTFVECNNKNTVIDVIHCIIQITNTVWGVEPDFSASLPQIKG